MSGINYRKAVQYELMLGRESMEAIQAFPVGYLPIGCLERHGDHLPMGLDVIKAHHVCCLAAKAIGGVVFPPHYYSGIHHMTPEQTVKYTGQWGNLYTDRTAKGHLEDVILQIAIIGIKVLVLYSGHYPSCQLAMMRELSEVVTEQPFRVIPFAEQMVLKGDHAGVSETSLMLYLDRNLVDTTRIGEVNYREHGWREENDPCKASSAKGERDVQTVLAHLRRTIDEALRSCLGTEP